MTNPLAAYRHFMGLVSYDDSIATRVFLSLLVLALVNDVMLLAYPLYGVKLYTGKGATVAIVLGVFALSFLFELPPARKSIAHMVFALLVIVIFIVRPVFFL